MLNVNFMFKNIVFGAENRKYASKNPSKHTVNKDLHVKLPKNYLCIF
jgi:hypothetical protein